jgi:hypothetical protein
MSVVAADLVIYGSANMPEADSGAAGGAIDTGVRVVPDSASLFNTLNDTVEILSSNAGDTTQTVTVYGRNAAGVPVNEPLSLNGTTVVNGATTFERIEKIVVDAAHSGTITVRKATGDTTIVLIETGVLTIRRPFINVSADVSGGSARVFYEKVLYKNNNGSNALLTATVDEDADPEAQLEFALEDAVNDNESVANRLTAPTGITGDGFSSTIKAVPGTDLAAGAAIGVWLKLSLPAGDPATKTTYTLELAGSTT